MSRSWPSGGTRRWRKIRLAVLNRDGWQCQLRLEGCRGHANEAHHLEDRAVVGDDPAYLVAACHPCNCKVGDPIRGDPDDPPVDFDPNEWTP